MNLSKFQTQFLYLYIAHYKLRKKNIYINKNPSLWSNYFSSTYDIHLILDFISTIIALKLDLLYKKHD